MIPDYVWEAIFLPLAALFVSGFAVAAGVLLALRLLRKKQ